MIVFPALSVVTVLLIATAVIALVDGIVRARGRGTAVLAVIEIIIAVLLILSLFVNIPFGRLGLDLALIVVLVLQLVFRGSARSRSGAALTVIGLVLAALLAIISLGWLHIPGVIG